MIDFNALVDELDSSGPTVAEVTRSRRQDDLMSKVLEALSKPQAAPNVTVNPEIKVPEQPPAQVVVQQQAQKQVSWTFEFERNGDGTIKRIHASPKE